MELRRIPDRIVIFARDIVNITGLSLRTAQRMIHKIRKIYGKPELQFVTIYEFCAVYGLHVEDVKLYLRV